MTIDTQIFITENESLAVIYSRNPREMPNNGIPMKISDRSLILCFCDVLMQFKKYMYSDFDNKDQTYFQLSNLQNEEMNRLGVEVKKKPIEKISIGRGKTFFCKLLWKYKLQSKRNQKS